MLGKALGSRSVLTSSPLKYRLCALVVLIPVEIKSEETENKKNLFLERGTDALVLFFFSSLQNKNTITQHRYFICFAQELLTRESSMKDCTPGKNPRSTTSLGSKIEVKTKAKKSFSFYLRLSN